MTKEVTPLVSEDLKKGDLVRWKKYKAMLGFVISPEPTYVGSIAIAVTPPDGYHDARTFATPDELEVIDLNALEAERSALLREVEKGAQYLNTLLAMFDNDGCVYPAQSLEADLKNEIIAFLSSHPT